MSAILYMITYRIIGRLHMDAIYSTTALRDRQKEVKEAARQNVVRITENGVGSYVFCSEDVFKREIDDAVERALYAERVKEAVTRGYVAAATGDVIEGTENAREAVRKMRASRD